MNIAASVFVTILLSGFVAAWIERPLPWNPKEKRPDKKETFVKFWKRAVLETLIRIDYDEWFKNFHPTKYSLASSFGEKFTCPPLKTKQPPISIHRITPADIKVVAAIGDQITAAFGAKASNLRNLFVEYRGISWSIGGKGNIQTAATIPNILKKYNPFVYGYSTGMTAVDNLKEKKAGFSSAESGSKLEGLKEQAEELISHIRGSENISFKLDWKLVTLWIGTTEICYFCQDDDYTVKYYMKHIRQALDTLESKMPRTFVNVIPVNDVSKISGLRSRYCTAFHKIICPCAITNALMVERMAKRYMMALQRLIDSGRYDRRHDFTVVLQPFNVNSELPRTLDGAVDRSYFAPDCTHPSAKAHAVMALSLWKNMLEPVGHKTQTIRWHEPMNVTCPKHIFPYLFTKQNTEQYFNIISNGTGVRPMRAQNGISYEGTNKQHANMPGYSLFLGKGSKKEKGSVLLIGLGICMVAIVAALIALIVRKHSNQIVDTARSLGNRLQNYHSINESQV